MRKPKAIVRRDPERTRGAIVAAAFTEYAEHGPAGARIDRIAAAAGVNKRMIYHYFGSKAGLWAGLLDAQGVAEAVPSTEAASIEEQLTAGEQRLGSRPAIARLLAWEALSAGAHAPDWDSTRAVAWRNRVARLHEAQREGRLPQRVDPAQLELALTALLLFPHVFPHITQLITGHAITDPAFIDGRNALFRLVSELLSPPAPAPAAPAPKPRFRLAAAVTEATR